jgi:hypothetical protein
MSIFSLIFVVKEGSNSASIRDLNEVNAAETIASKWLLIWALIESSSDLLYLIPDSGFYASLIACIHKQMLLSSVVTYASLLYSFV